MKGPARGRSGSSIVEVVVAITILGVAAVGLAGMALRAGQTANDTGLTAARDAALSNISELVVATPFANLAALAGCRNVMDSAFKYTYCIRVEGERLEMRQMTVKVMPDYVGALADSAVVFRSRGTASTPF